MICVLATLWAGAVYADFDAAAYPPYERCALCHGLFGVSANARFPNLGGQEPVYLETQIRAFLAGDRHNDGGQMAAVVSELKPEEIPVVVQWFSSQDAPPPAETGAAGEVQTGRILYQAGPCSACHDADHAFIGVPHLTSQHAGYLGKQMRDFRDGRRAAHSGCLPHGPMMPTQDSDIDAIAAYLAQVPRP